jgi:hypothetical protein
VGDVAYQRAKDSERRVRSEYAKPLATPAQKEANTMATTKDNSGALFKNQRKDEGNSNAPDYSGDLLIESTRYRLAGWIKESSRGKFLSLSVKPDEQQPSKQAVNGKPHAKAGEDDEISF